jgi:hypothetical protein
VADNPPVAARVVAFNRGTCGGMRSYNAIEWFFPRYGESFSPSQFIRTCSTNRMRVQAPHEEHCPDVTLSDGVTVLSEIDTIHVTCPDADALITQAPVLENASGGPFAFGAYRYGTQGPIGGLPTLFDCQPPARPSGGSL